MKGQGSFHLRWVGGAEGLADDDAQAPELTVAAAEPVFAAVKAKSVSWSAYSEVSRSG